MALPREVALGSPSSILLQVSISGTGKVRNYDLVLYAHDRDAEIIANVGQNNVFDAKRYGGAVTVKSPTSFGPVAFLHVNDSSKPKACFDIYTLDIPVAATIVATNEWGGKAAATVAASALVAGYMASAASETTARINEQAHRQVLTLSESLSVTSTYTCGSEFCIDVMNNSGRQIWVSYAYDDSSGNPISYHILNASGETVAKLPHGAGTIALTPSALASAVLISENFLVYGVA